MIVVAGFPEKMATMIRSDIFLVSFRHLATLSFVVCCLSCDYWCITVVRSVLVLSVCLSAWSRAVGCPVMSEVSLAQRRDLDGLLPGMGASFVVGVIWDHLRRVTGPAELLADCILNFRMVDKVATSLRLVKILKLINPLLKWIFEL